MSASIDAYRSVNVSTANPRDVIIKLYATAARNLRDAEVALAAGERADDPLSKTQAIVGGLMSALDFDAGDLAKKLLNLYLFVLDRVHQSTASSKDHGLAEARAVLETLQAGWEEMPVEEASRQPNRAAESSARLNFRG